MESEQILNKIVYMILKDQAKTLEELMWSNSFCEEDVKTLAALYEVMQYNYYEGIED